MYIGVMNNHLLLVSKFYVSYIIPSGFSILRLSSCTSFPYRSSCIIHYLDLDYVIL
uniref:Uncharacterized protein n=1 Tax=Arundo donax TaxID=35708 RepID=A0A0A9FCR0_ARUDO